MMLTRVLTGNVLKAVGGTADQLFSVIDTADDSSQFVKELTEKSVANPIKELERTRLVFVPTVAADPAPDEAYSLDVRINPPAANFYVTVTVHGTDGFTSEASAYTDSSGYARRVIEIPGA